MKTFLAALATFLLFQQMSNAQLDFTNRSLERIEVYVTPFYNSSGPYVHVGPYSDGLASTNEAQFVKTIQTMKSKWGHLNFVEMYVAAARLYDWGYRKESIYWFYSAQYQGRLFASLLPEHPAGNLGDAGFELSSANGAFFQLTGPYINAFAFRDPTHLTKVLERVKKDGATIPDFNRLFPNVTFKNKSEWPKQSKVVGDGLSNWIARIPGQVDELKAERARTGIDVKTAKLSNKDFPEKK